MKQEAVFRLLSNLPVDGIGSSWTIGGIKALFRTTVTKFYFCL